MINLNKNLKKEIFITNDGSTSVFVPDIDEQYHSKNGAVQEALHVYISSGLHLFKDNANINILEIGFGTGLNCLISVIESISHNYKINYVGVEAYPLKMEIIKHLNYHLMFDYKETKSLFYKMHSLPINVKERLTKNFWLTKQNLDFKKITATNKYNLVYYDAFGANIQPELWTELMFKKMFDALLPNGILVTYAAKGSVRRAMQSVGFTIERLAGPIGKREMLRAIKK